jgi:sugar/nucleoside kinase (ribokinase family)
MSVLIVGSIAIDDIITPTAQESDLLGGSASYAAISASFFAPVDLVGIVGHDFPEEHIQLFEQRKINLEGLQRADGPNFRWTGEYMDNMNKRETRNIALNVFETFMPDLPESYKSAEHILLGNISPDLQLHVLNQLTAPKLVIADTMDLWITIAREKLDELVSRVDILILNDSEAEDYTGEKNLVKAARSILARGPRYVVIKKGEHGALLFGMKGELLGFGAFPLEEVVDPTGAGDTFAGAFAGYLASVDSNGTDTAQLSRAIQYGTVLASYNVQSFSAHRLVNVSASDVEGRLGAFRALSELH